MKKIYVLLLMLFLNSCGQSLPPNLKAKIDQNKRVKLNIGEELTPKVDILFVIDNSGSMSTHQIHLKNQIEYYANEILKITAIDFHIDVLGSDANRALDGLHLTRKTPNFLAVLKRRLLIGATGGGVEKFFSPVHTALKQQVNGQGTFLRENAALNLIFITDTDDQSANISPQRFYNFLLSLKKKAAKIITFAALIKKPSCRGELPSSQITLLPTFIRFTNGVTVDLCSGYSRSLIELAEKVVRQALVFKLKEVPIYESIYLSYGTMQIPRDVDKGWSYNPETVSIRISPNFFKEVARKKIKGKLQLSYKKARPSDL